MVTRPKFITAKIPLGPNSNNELISASPTCIIDSSGEIVDSFSGGPSTAIDLTSTNTRIDSINSKLVTSASSPIGTENVPIFRSIPSGTQPISAAILPLPTGAATNTTLQTVVDRLMPTTGTNVYSSLGTSAGENIKASAGNILNIYCCNLRASTDTTIANLNSATRYLQLFNSISTPSGVPIRSYPIYPNNGVLILGQDFLAGEGMEFTTGITWGISTTPLTYTAATTNETIVNIRYK